MLQLAVTILILAAQWRVFQKMARAGWEGIIPIYNTYVLFDILYGNGWRMLLLLIPFYNIYLTFRLNIDLAEEFHLGAGFGVGLTLLNPVFLCILAFGRAEFGDGSRAYCSTDPISETIDSAVDFVSGTVSGHSRRDPEALNKLEQLKKLHDEGILSDEEYEKMKQDLLKRV